MAGRLVFKRVGETVPAFLQRLPPSQTSPSVVQWICARRKDEKWSPPEVPAKLQERFDVIFSSSNLAEDDEQKRKDLTIVKLARLLEQEDVVGGKWAWQVDRDDVDTQWEQIMDGMYAGDLGDMVQVSTAAPTSDVHAICVHTPDFTDSADVARVVKSIRRLGVSTRLFYKPLGATMLGLYPGIRPWGARNTSLYFAAEGSAGVLEHSDYSERVSMMHSWRRSGLDRQL
eukprot:Hpha_TRINITY_DN16753_c3_g1::TRINITY_DN16753_c3_g1_i1::g.77742::m.77742